MKRKSFHTSPNRASTKIEKLHVDLAGPFESYGLKQAPRVWKKALTAFIMFLGFIQSHSHGALFMLFSEELGFVLILCYVDDIQIAAKKLSNVNIIKKKKPVQISW